MNDDLKFVLSAVFIALLIVIAFVGSIGALMYWDAYIKISMPVP